MHRLHEFVVYTFKQCIYSYMRGSRFKLVKFIKAFQFQFVKINFIFFYYEVIAYAYLAEKICWIKLFPETDRSSKRRFFFTDYNKKGKSFLFIWPKYKSRKISIRHIQGCIKNLKFRGILISWRFWSLFDVN